ncbi:MAG TPA: glycine oxidase ThiO [Acidiferrobacterales bacterium]
MANPWYVIGGGLIGLLCAYELRQAGKEVIVLDRGQVGRGASWAGGGILSPLYPWRYPPAVNVLATWGQERYPELAGSLRASTGTDPEWTRSGLLVIGESDVISARTWCENHGKAAKILTSEQLAALEPEVGAVPGSVILIEDVAQIRNPRLLVALREKLLQMGVEIRENTTVNSVIVRNRRISGLCVVDSEISTDRCLVAGGAWSGDLLAAVGVQLPIRPVRGQMILYRLPQPVFSHILLKDYHYLIPRRDGHVLVGSTFEDAGFDLTPTESARRELQTAALELLPLLNKYPVLRQWAGLRPGSPQGVPFIGEHPGISGLFVCAGHFRNGIVMGPASARLAADLMLGRPPTFDPAPYALH